MRLKEALQGAFLIGLLTPTLCLADELPIVGLDKNRQETIRSLSKEAYTRQFQSVIMTVHESTLPALRAQEKKSRWMLRDVVVGLGMSVSAGIGPIWKATVSTAIKLCYSNSTHPKITD